ncbi:PRD domain-containing protein [Salipaludibacillus agaradhaerens]|uniref:BglG family transcription antiterminator LicT n=1 Tax=Salipaludibacillus agaradhaerens TaxID=76935 RepID=UPI0021512EF4|nr:PRD domain-containing protein [Salipaludibacillus agaradhaerens]MCR6108444.1 PRD domain-containing protein [Salipaludibacillus agaradhaerens]MCR6120465.1 PRD domain-containing protein [Salipaludibacillus agaradhaerens]UJW59473.1 PRD domain-containing protein [Bacillus sp. A116_S68]
MRIKKILNNNVVVTTNDQGQEIVVMGKGLAFMKKVGQTIDQSKIEKTFVLEKHGMSEKLVTLLRETPELHFNIAAKILDYATSQLPYKLDDYLYVALTDHISFAITRHHQGIEMKNPLLWEIRKYYKQEYNISLKALDIIEKEAGVTLSEDEAASIALHLVNSQLSGENMATAVQVTEMVNTILTIVKYHFKMELDETSINYERFLTHLRFFAMRFIRQERIVETNDHFLYEQLHEKYPEAFQCSEKIKVYLAESYKWHISKDEMVYLTVHIQRVTKRYEYHR